MKRNALIWDLPTRLFHWLLVMSIVAQYVTANWLDNGVQWHFYIGYFTLFLVVFRLLWGFVGTRYAKFTEFVKGPKAVINYLRTFFDKHGSHTAGHNPLGGWFVLAMLLLVTAQAVSGLFMTDDIFWDGPYRQFATDELLALMSYVHHLAFDTLLYVIGLHISAIIFYAVFKKQRLAAAMVHGKKEVSIKEADLQHTGIEHSMLIRALVIALVAALLVYLAIDVLPPTPDADDYYY